MSALRTYLKINTIRQMNTIRLILCLGIITLFSACSHKNELNISGNIKNGKDKIIYLQKLNLSEATTIDSVEIKNNGNFRFSLPKLEYPTFFLLKLSDKEFITLLADSTECIEVEADTLNFSKTYTVKNSLDSKYIQVLNTKFNKTKIEVDSLLAVYNSAKGDSDQQNMIREKIVKVVDKQKDFISDFVMANHRSFASYYAVFQRFDDGSLLLDPYQKKDLNLFTTVATSFDVFYPQSPRSEHLKNFVLSIQKEKKVEEMKKKITSSSISKSIPEVEEENLDGKKIKLSSLKGKLVLLSFWASWDEKSRKENKNLVKIYKKYKSKGFEIYQVSLDKSKILWEGAIEQDKLPWINVSDLQYTNSYPARIYNIQQLPANYLISKKGEIIGKDLFGRILDEKLNDLLN